MSTTLQINYADKQATSMTPFVFASLDGRSSSSSARRVHLRRLCDILHLSIQRGDLLRAQSSFALLSRSEGVQWAAIWKFALIILAATNNPNEPPTAYDILGTPKRIEFLRVMMLRHPEEVRKHFCFRFCIPDPATTHHLPIWTARIAREGAGIVTGYSWTGARRPR